MMVMTTGTIPASPIRVMGSDHMWSFLNFCKNMTFPAIPDIESDSVDAPANLVSKIDNVANDIERKIENIDHINIGYIEEAFSDMQLVTKKMKEIGDDVPDEVLNRFAVNIFGEPFNKLSNVERSIIAVLGVYILI